AQHKIARAQQRDEMPLVTVGKIGGVNKTEGRRCQQFLLLAFAGGGLDEIRRIPFAEKNLQSLHLEPAFQQINLRGLPRTIQALDGNEAARIFEFGEGFYCCADASISAPPGKLQTSNTKEIQNVLKLRLQPVHSLIHKERRGFNCASARTAPPRHPPGRESPPCARPPSGAADTRPCLRVGGKRSGCV